MTIKQEMQQAQLIVKDILKRNPVCRESRLDLLLAYWQEIGVGLTTPQVEKIRSGLNPETIRRISQHIQNDLGEFASSKKIKNLRMKREVDIREHLMTRTKEAVYGVAQDGTREMIGWR